MNADGIKRKLATVEYSDWKGGESNRMGGKKEKRKWSEIPMARLSCTVQVKQARTEK